MAAQIGTSGSAETTLGTFEGGVSAKTGVEASGSVGLKGSGINTQVDLKAHYEDGVAAEARGSWNYGNGTLTGEISGRIGTEADLKAEVGLLDSNVELEAQVGAWAKAGLTNEVEFVDGVTLTSEFEVEAHASMGVEASAGHHIGSDGAGASAYGSAHIGVEVGASRRETVGVGDSQAMGGAGVSIGASVGASGGGEFSLTGDGITLGGAVDLDLGIGLSVEAKLEVDFDDIGNAAGAVANVGSDAAKEVVNVGSDAAKEAAKVASNVGNVASKAADDFVQIASNPVKSIGRVVSGW